MNAMEKLYQVILERKASAQEGSYTGYLFEQGLDKILKKCAEECGEVIIAAKNGRVEDTIGEISDLLYHLTVLMANEGIAWEQVEAELERRAQKQGNLKKFHQVDKDT
ncbi:MAG: phosphoribosyl-ATP diphosphatase [Acutalibacter sp.]|jgi:phosphoribosyl-ATP pyrophosphohydrolase|uniref:phosphoribosyl-ATP diphosphatase n=1 Tax=Acutalibacter sp. TaxID=1918636 RepID=UPI002173E234|nr:phosphoribosyl-ATP diphosphatase [Acutalibacter sp.]MCI9225247.1 phosphoribosyl-ATP diphosphatase [Acutalibacter sp.]